ncbi:MAG TPA: Ig-like domain-containing protein, partial [Candidatus Rifleibacterium sp.]|nr:Ig-like domain-containing protein [Candidatus Rifleibacterium sp.]
KFITAGTSENTFPARLTSSQIVAVMRDVSAPRISLDQDIDLTEPLRSARPEFKGQIEEYGSGLNQAETLVSINGGVPQPVAVDATGRFTFKPLAPLANGEHELVIRATDQTGNMAQTAAIRFQVALPLQIDQIMQYPNPARNRGFIRISANSGSLTDDLVKIRIYDTAGHKVAALGNVRAVKENFAAGGSRYLYDIAWDLRNEDGKTVANGVYIARIEVLDPLNPAIKVKKTCKLAVLR